MSEPSGKPFLYVVVCAAGVAEGVGRLIAAARERGWEVGVIATPQGLGFFDAAAVELPQIGDGDFRLVVAGEERGERVTRAALQRGGRGERGFLVE